MRRLTLGVMAMAMAMLTGCDAEGVHTVGPEGGIVRSADGRVTLEIPAGALAQDVAITIGEIEDGPADAVGMAYEVEPAGLVLAVPATLTFDMSVASEEEDREFDLAAAGLSVEEIAVVTDHGDEWTRLADLEADADADLVSASATFLSTYAIVAR
jgi:hypothetical protein